jgi:hypothetical protein
MTCLLASRVAAAAGRRLMAAWWPLAADSGIIESGTLLRSTYGASFRLST